MTPAEYNAEMARYCEALAGWGLARVEREIVARLVECQRIDGAWQKAKDLVIAESSSMVAQAAREQYRLACRRLAKLKEQR